MIQAATRLKVADNTGARTIECIRVMGRSAKTTAGIGDVIIASVKQAIPNAAVKKGDVVRAVVVAIVDRVRHRRYQKTVQRTKHLYAHDETNDVREGDRVRVQETRPLSKLKRWRLLEILERAK